MSCFDSTESNLLINLEMSNLGGSKARVGQSMEQRPQVVTWSLSQVTFGIKVIT